MELEPAAQYLESLFRPGTAALKGVASATASNPSGFQLQLEIFTPTSDQSPSFFFSETSGSVRVLTSIFDHFAFVVAHVV